MAASDYVPLYIQGIKLVMAFLPYVFTKKEAEPPAKQQPETPESDVSSSIAHEPEKLVFVVQEPLNKEELKDVIEQTAGQFSKLIEVQSRNVLNELKAQRVRECIQEVQARTSSLKILLNSPTLDQNIAFQLVISALNPLQVSLEIAKIRLQEYGESESWEVCYVIGTSALLAGYGFLGQDAPHLRTDLSDLLRKIQKRILNEAAVNMVYQSKEIPWENVPYLLSPEGADDLLKLYEEANNSSYELPQPGIDIDVDIDVRNAIKSHRSSSGDFYVSDI